MAVFRPQAIHFADVTSRGEGIDFVLAQVFHQLRELIIGEQGLQLD